MREVECVVLEYEGAFAVINFLPNYGLSKLASRYNDLAREADAARLARLATVPQSKWSTRVAAGLGDWLISSGLSLKQRAITARQNVPAYSAPPFMI
jgi:hypothetical protein